MQPHWIDLMIAAILLTCAVWGILSGGIRIAGPFVLAIGAVMIADRYPEIVAALRAGPAAQGLVVIKLLAVIGLMAYGVLARFIHAAVHATGLGVFNRLLGVCLGGITGLVLAGCVVSAATTYGGAEIEVALAGSQLAEVTRQVFALITVIAEQTFSAPPTPATE